METLIALALSLSACVGFMLTCVKLYESKTVQKKIKEHKEDKQEEKYQLMY